MKLTRFVCFVAFVCIAASISAAGTLNSSSFKGYVDTFNKHDDEFISFTWPNSKAWEFMEKNIPFFECPDKDIEKIYYFRWWTFRKHVVKTADGWVITEFLPQVGWSGSNNVISCAAGHHFRESRWLHDRQIVDDYANYYRENHFKRRTKGNRYSFWAADSIYACYLVKHDSAWATGFLADLIANYKLWKKEYGNKDPVLYWRKDGDDGMELSCGGSGIRPTINSYQYGDARAIAAIARLAGRKDVAEEYDGLAAELKKNVQDRLWNKDLKFFTTINPETGKLTNVRELLGFVPWYFNLPGEGYEAAWSQLMDPKGFSAPFGLTTAEQRSPLFAINRKIGHVCEWKGPVWPYATTQTLIALANLLNDYKQDIVSKRDYLETLKTYAKSQRNKVNGIEVPWIDEDLDPFTGEWLSRALLFARWKNKSYDNAPAMERKCATERGKDYNHSGYADLIITGLAGLRPRADDVIEVNPLVPEGVWDYFCLDNVLYHGRIITIIWDKTGEKYGKGKGLAVFVDDKELARADKLGLLKVPMK